MNKCFFKLLYFLLIIFVCLSGCSQLSNVKQKTLPMHPVTIPAWTLTGKISIQTPTENKQAFLYWQQNDNHYDIRLFGPLGIGGIELVGRKNDIQLRNAQGKVYQARSPEALLKQQLGITLPIANLQYWIRGLRAPNLPATMGTKTGSTSMIQQNWEIHYLSYQPQNQNNCVFRVPKLIKLIYPADHPNKKAQMQLIIIINSYLPIQ